MAKKKIAKKRTDRDLTTIQLPKSTVAILDEGLTGVTKVHAIKSVFEWLFMQDEITQAVALGQLHKTYTVEIVPLPKDESK